MNNEERNKQVIQNNVGKCIVCTYSGGQVHWTEGVEYLVSSDGVVVDDEGDTWGSNESRFGWPASPLFEPVGDTFFGTNKRFTDDELDKLAELVVQKFIERIKGE